VTLRVGLLHYTSPPVVGGVEIVLGHHARLISDAGHRVRIISGRGSDRRFETVGIPLADARRPAIRALRAELDVGRVPSSFAPVVRGLRMALDRAADGLDVLVAHNVCTMHLNLALTGALHGLATSGAGPPVMAWDHDIAAASPGAAEVLHPGQPWDLLRTPWPGVTHVTISDARRAELATTMGLDAAAIAVVPNGLDV